MIHTLDAEATGNRIKQLRKERGYTVEELAELMSFESVQAVYKWQRGDSMPSMDNLVILSGILNVSLDEIEKISAIVGAMIEQRHNRELSQRDLAQLCGIPHSSVARIESGKTTPNLSTLLKILGLPTSVLLGLFFMLSY